MDAYQTLLAPENPELNDDGSLDIRASLQSSGALLSGFGTIEDNLMLNLVKEAGVNPREISVFNHPDNRDFVSVSDGSGYFEVLNTNGNAAESRYLPSNQTIRIRPLSHGDVQLTVRDLCLSSHSHSPHVLVHVTGIHVVELVTETKVQLGNKIRGKVKLLDANGNEISDSALKYIKVSLNPNNSGILRAVAVSDSVVDFEVKGLELGETNLVASVQIGSSNIINSKPKLVQVFPPLQIEPKNVTLLIGAKFQVQTTGGPQPDTRIEFSLDNNQIALTDDVGLIEATKLGSTKLVAKSVGTDKVRK